MTFNDPPPAVLTRREAHALADAARPLGEYVEQARTVERAALMRLDRLRRHLLAKQHEPRAAGARGSQGDA